MPGGNSGPAWEIADWTSCAAASIARLRSNCRMIWVAPRAFVEFIAVKPAIVENCRSSGVATDDAIVSGLAPGKLALTRSVGKSTFGRSLTGSWRYAITPNNTKANVTRLVEIG